MRPAAKEGTMERRSEAPARSGTLGLCSRRRFLKKALIAAAYVTPVVVSYPSTVFATHQCGMMVMGGTEMCMGLTYSPGCSLL